MSNILQKALVLLVCLSVVLATECPVGIEVTSFSNLVGQNFASVSEFYDALYEIKVNSVGNSYTLTGYKITQVDNIANADFDVETFTKTAEESWKILQISKLGNCVLIDNRPNVIAFETSTKNFVMVQNITEPTFTTAQTNDDCSIIKVTLKDGSKKVYMNSSVNNQLLFPSEAIFDTYFTYGIDSTGSLKKLSGNSFEPVPLKQEALKSTPVSIINRKDINSLILVTKSSDELQHTVTVISTQDDSQVYTNTWSSSDISGALRVNVASEGTFVLIQDSKGFLILLNIEQLTSTNTGTQASTIKVAEVTLEDVQHYSLFQQESVISLTETAVITYLNGKLTYFQPYQGTLYYVAQIVTDLEAEAIQFANLSSSEARLIPTHIQPESFQTCSIFPDNNGADNNGTDNNGTDNNGTENGGSGGGTDNNVDESGFEQEDEATAIDQNGNVRKCQPECLSCTGKGLCKVCTLGYALSAEGDCVFCEGCKSCLATAPQKCLSCFKPYVLNSTTKKCDKPLCTQKHCLTCDSSGRCVECQTGFSPFNGECVECQEGCPSCTKGGADTCDDVVSDCKPGFVYYPTPSRKIKFTCSQCAAGCLGCTTSDISNCTACNDGYFTQLNQDNNKMTCKTCMDNCQTCTNATICTKCQSGFKLNSDSTQCIEKCDDKCLTCSDNNSTECKSCFAGSKLIGAQCVADLGCNTAKTCSFCGDGYALQSGECLKCQVTDTNCKACSIKNLTACTKCVSGYYMNEKRQCVKCSSECVTCQNDQACTKCNDGFYLSKIALSATGKCLACVSTCKTCRKHPYLCTSCKTGFILDGSKCINQNKVDYSVTVTSDVGAVVVLVRTFVTVLIEVAEKSSINPAKLLKVTNDDISIKHVKKGSAVLEGAISTGDSAQSSALANMMASQLNGVALEDGYTILSAQAVAVAPTTTTTESSSSTNLGLILGVTIPLSLILLIGVIIILVKLKRRKQEEQGDKASNTNQNYYVNESQKYIDKFSAEESEKI